MSSFDIVRAWKDAEYRQSLSAEEQALLPEHPAGAIELTDEDLDRLAGAQTEWVATAGCCPTPAISLLYPTVCVKKIIFG
ncbi:MAG TPA: mersacidin/lichenicidin family type 2 lantibiotic [Ktedonobacterales bacterium]|jgi:mersacidin/lichenicidin family type 2 lantibiotic